MIAHRVNTYFSIFQKNNAGHHPCFTGTSPAIHLSATKAAPLSYRYGAMRPPKFLFFNFDLLTVSFFSFGFKTTPLTSNLPVNCRIGFPCTYYHIENVKKNMETGRRVTGRGRKSCAFRIVNLPPYLVSSVVSIPRRPPLIACTSCIFALILQDAAAVPPVSVGIIVCNTHGNTFSCKFYCISFLVRKFCQFWPFSVCACCRLLDGRGMGPGDRRRCRSPSVRCLARNIGRRATPLPSPRRRSFLPVSASRWWSPFCSGVLLLRVSCWGLWCWFLLRWVWLYTGVYSSLFNRARNKRARTREDWRRSFPLLCPLRGCWRRFSLGVGVGAFLQRSESVAGRFCSISIFTVALSKIRTGIKLAPLGRFWFRPGGAGLGFFGCPFWVKR